MIHVLPMDLSFALDSHIAYQLPRHSIYTAASFVILLILKRHMSIFVSGIYNIRFPGYFMYLTICLCVYYNAHVCVNKDIHHVKSSAPLTSGLKFKRLVMMCAQTS